MTAQAPAIAPEGSYASYQGILIVSDARYA